MARTVRKVLVGLILFGFTVKKLCILNFEERDYIFLEFLGTWEVIHNPNLGLLVNVC